MVGGDETDEENAARELEEEIGVTGVKMEVLGRTRFEDEGNRVWGSIFGVEYAAGGELKIQESEVESVEWWSQE